MKQCAKVYLQSNGDTKWIEKVQQGREVAKKES